MLPTASAESPATRSRCATSAVVVVLPFVPVIATVRVLPPPPLPARARNPRSTSEKIGTPAARAAARGGASGGTPGETPQLGERVAGIGVIRRVARVHAHPLPGEQPRCRDAALPQPHHRHDALTPALGDHRTFSVASAIAAHSTPRM